MKNKELALVVEKESYWSSTPIGIGLGDLRDAVFIRRDNRFRATVRMATHETWAHVPNSGRMQELLYPGRRVWVRQSTRPGRKTGYDLVVVDLEGELVSIDSRVPNQLLQLAFEHKLLEPFASYSRILAEVPWGKSRLDFRLGGSEEVDCLVEAKSVTLVREGTALFPDAPTLRGRKHLQELIRARCDGMRAAVVFVVQRQDAKRFTPNAMADGDFASALGEAVSAGVEIYAYNCVVTKRAVGLLQDLEVRL